MSDLLTEILDANGTQDAWNKYDRIITTLSFGGLAFALKFNSKGVRARRVLISLKNPMVVFEQYPVPGLQGIFTPELVWIESIRGQRRSERRAPRGAFFKFPHTLYWNDLDLLYFAGYAVWNYFNLPFLLTQPGVQVREIGKWNERGEDWLRLKATFPEEIPTHCREQVFYFDRGLRIRRHDYDPEIFASRAKAAHYCYDYSRVKELWFPQFRRVYPRKKDGTVASRPLLVWIRAREIHLQGNPTLVSWTLQQNL